MADLQSFLIFQRYSDEFERVVLHRRNPFDEYDEVNCCLPMVMVDIKFGVCLSVCLSAERI